MTSIPQESVAVKPLHDVADAVSYDAPASSVLVCGDHHMTLLKVLRSQRRITGLQSYELPDPLGILSDDASLKKYFPGITEEGLQVFLTGFKHVLVPDVLYDKNAENDLFALNYPLSEDEMLIATRLRHVQARLLFAMPQALFKHLQALLPKAEIMHKAVAWLEGLFLQYKNVTEQHVHVDIDERGIQLAVFRDGQLQFFNSFPAPTAEDKLYFIMFVSEQLRANPLRDPYYISGVVRKGDELHRLLSKYIKELKWQPRPPMFEYSMPLNSLPEHFYYQAYCTPVCE